MVQYDVDAILKNAKDKNKEERVDWRLLVNMHSGSDYVKMIFDKRELLKLTKKESKQLCSDIVAHLLLLQQSLYLSDFAKYLHVFKDVLQEDIIERASILVSTAKGEYFRHLKEQKLRQYDKTTLIKFEGIGPKGNLKEYTIKIDHITKKIYTNNTLFSINGIDCLGIDDKQITNIFKLLNGENYIIIQYAKKQYICPFGYYLPNSGFSFKDIRNLQYTNPSQTFVAIKNMTNNN